jgi:hypothetical protein
LIKRSRKNKNYDKIYFSLFSFSSDLLKKPGFVFLSNLKVITKWLSFRPDADLNGHLWRLTSSNDGSNGENDVAGDGHQDHRAGGGGGEGRCTL